MLSNAEIKTKIIAIRDSINVYLGRLSSTLNESEDAIIYPSDLSGRHDKLQAIVGRYTFQQNTSISLYAFLINPALMTFRNLTSLIKQLRELLKPIDGLPPINEVLKSLIDGAIVELILIKKERRQVVLNEALNAVLSSDSSLGY